MSRCSPILGGCLIGLAAIGLAGCDSEPNETDMRSALGRIPLLVEMVKAFAGGDVTKTKVEKYSCVTARDAPGYVCDFRWGMPKGSNSFEYGVPQKRRFYKAADGWMIDVN